MESNALLIRAASGFEKLMSSTPVGAVLKDSTVAQVSAAIYYQSNVLANIMSSKKMSNIFSTLIFDQAEKDFGSYIDAQANIKRKQFHHVYEWDKAGNKAARLFKLNKINVQDMSFSISYDFLPSRSMVPAENSKRRHVFVNKASVMEEGVALKISPRHAERLVFSIDGNMVFLKPGQSVVVSKPGGVGVKDSFKTIYRLYFKGNLISESIKRSGFAGALMAELRKSLNLPAYIKRISYSFSPGMVARDARAAVL